MPILLYIDDYNQPIGGADTGITDQLNCYDTQLTSFRTWRPMLFWVFDMFGANRGWPGLPQ